MDRPRSDCRDSGGGYLGAGRFRYQQPDSAFHGENHGYGCPVAPVPWQWPVQHAGPVYFGTGALLCRDCRSNPEFLDTAQTKARSIQAGESKLRSGAAGRFATPGGCASSSCGISAATGPCSRPRNGPGVSSRAITAGKPVAKPILVAA